MSKEEILAICQQRFPEGANPDAGHDAQHNSWMKEKVDQGWAYGEVKDADAKTHPCIVPFNELPEFQRKKDALFCAIVDALK